MPGSNPIMVHTRDSLHFAKENPRGYWQDSTTRASEGPAGRPYQGSRSKLFMLVGVVDPANTPWQRRFQGQLGKRLVVEVPRLRGYPVRHRVAIPSHAMQGMESHRGTAVRWQHAP